MAATGLHPQVSIVVEWENARLSRLSRSISMLRALREQVTEISVNSHLGPGLGEGAPFFELIIVYDLVEFDESELAGLVQHSLGDPDTVLYWRLFPIRDAGYYKNKNIGALP